MNANTCRAWPESQFGGPRIIGHRGASYHAWENSLLSFQRAAELGADMWELDVRLSADGVVVLSHDASLERLFGCPGEIAQLSFAELKARAPELNCLSEVIELGRNTGCGLYIELKDDKAGPVALAQLREQDYPYAAFGSFEVPWIAELVALGCEYPTAVLVPVGADPFAMAKAAGVSAIHLCWERASETPHSLVTEQLLAEAQEQGLQVVLWHEERPAEIDRLMALPVAAVCSDRPELLVPFPSSTSRGYTMASYPQVVCHRGAEQIAPENTLAAISRAFEQGFAIVEVDVQQTADGQLLVMHDESLDRTTTGCGLVAENSWSDIQEMDAGSWFDSHFASERVPSLAQAIELAKQHSAGLYIELKQCEPEKVWRLVEQMDFAEQCFFWGFDQQKLHALRALSPRARLMARIEDFPSAQATVEAFDACLVEVLMRPDDLARTRAEVTELQALGAEVMVCYQGDDTALFRQILSLAPALINLRRPDIYKRVLHAAARASENHDR